MSAQAARAFSPDPVSHEAQVVIGHEVGGTVGDLHRMLAERLAPMSSPAPAPVAIPFDEKLVRFASRATGYALLAGGFAASAWLLF